MARSTFSTLGLPIGQNNINMTYLYGLSDFFSVMFENPDRVNLLLEANSEVASQVYSRFLQMTSNSSLDYIQNTSGQSIKLITVLSTNLVQGETNLYTLSNNVVSSRYIANRPLLPTSLLEEDVDYRLEQTATGEFRIRFAQDISQAGFSTRTLTDGSTKEYAMWFVDSEIDEEWISTYFGNLVGLAPEASTDVFRNFVYGLFYIYANGPTIDLLRKGLNLTLGIPLCRGTETVLEIRKYLETDQYIVVTDANQYVIPYGLLPIVAEGDVLQISDELAQWVEVKDYLHDGEWWINLLIPSSIIPSLPEGQINRYATQGSHLDYLMRNYLKKHTFLVNVKVESFKNNQLFEQLSAIINRAKPTYTQAIYIWSIPQLEEDFTLTEDILLQRRDQARCDNLVYAIEKFNRANSTDALIRGCPTFTRFNAPMHASKLLGKDTYTNGNPIAFEGGISNGFIDSVHQYRTNTDAERAWIRAVDERNSEVNNLTRGKIGFSRGIHNQTDVDIGYSGIPAHPSYGNLSIPVGMKIIPLYTTTQTDLQNKCNAVGITTPDLVQWYFELLNPFSASEEINALAINEGLADTTVSILAQNYNTLMFRGSDVNYLGNVIPELGWQTWAPINVSYINISDYLIGVRIYGDVMGIYLVTSNTNIDSPIFFPVGESGELDISFSTRPARALGPTSSSYYLIRGRGLLDYTNVRADINAGAINDSETMETSILNTAFSDSANTIPTTYNRSGSASLNHRMELN